MISAPSQAKPEKSYLAAAVESISPWSASRSSTPKPDSKPAIGPESMTQQGLDHSLNRRNGISSQRYPQDCPPLNSRWFYAVDVPKRKPKLLKEASKDSKPLPLPKKFVPFSIHDSRSIELAFQKLIEEDEDNGTDHVDGKGKSGLMNAVVSVKENTSMNEAGNLKHAGGRSKVPVNEDFLFDVDIETRELAPVYWLGPIYDVRRGSWFYQEGSILRPCDENLATQLEEGYLKVKPFRYPKVAEIPKISLASTKIENDVPSLEFPSTNGEVASDLTPKPSIEDLRTSNKYSMSGAPPNNKDTLITAHEPQTHRLFGTYMNTIVTYQDETTAWLSSDGIMSRVSSTVYQKFAGGGYLGGVKLVRGFAELGKSAKSAEAKVEQSSAPSASLQQDSRNIGLHPDERQKRILKQRSAPPGTTTTVDYENSKGSRPSGQETRESLLKRQISSMVIDSMDPEKGGEEAARRRDENEIQTDYIEHDGEDQARPIEHLILVTHGIGQRLGMRTESVNFVHDVNILRQNVKNVYSNSADLQALNSEIDRLPKNCRVQVLPVCWRHLLDFPRQGVRRSREQDLGANFEDEGEYPSLEDITIEGIPFVRSLITDLALDILLYQSAYREHISVIVLQECNRIYKLFMNRNPYFEGKVSLIGHSLGSAILFDLLCRQKETVKMHGPSQHSRYYRDQAKPRAQGKKDDKDLSFDFAVEDFYCLGSPIGLFQMLKGRTIAARQHPGSLPAESPMDPDEMDDPFLAASTPGPTYSTGEKISSITGLPYTISSPKCSQLYNIFHPSDPIGYRLEPLIAPAMSSLKPQALPYTKKGIFGTSTTQGLTGISARVGQSVSGFWSSLSSGIASSLLNRSLGLTGEDIASMVEPQSSATRESHISIGAGTNISDGGVIPAGPPLKREDTNEKKRQLAENTAAADRDGRAANAPTLIDDEIETLYAGFQKRRQSQQSDEAHNYEGKADAEEKGKKLRREEMKVRGLNQTGRVDFSIQESVLDFNPINTIASHLSYWADEDVSHFILSQLLSRHRKQKFGGSPDHQRSKVL